MEYIGKKYGCQKIDGIAVFQPADIADGEWNELYNLFYGKINESLGINTDIYNIAEFIDFVSQRCSTVSSICDFGILYDNGEIKRIRHSADEIKKSFNNNKPWKRIL
mgnify:CR=1 FL=1